MKTLRIMVVCVLCTYAVLLVGCKLLPFGKKDKEPQAPGPTTTAQDTAQPLPPDMVRLPRGEYEKLRLMIAVLEKEAQYMKLQQAQETVRGVSLAVTPEERDMVIADVQRVHSQLSDLRSQRDALDRQIRSLQAQLAALQARLGGESAAAEGIFGIESRREAKALEPGLEKKIE
jgi:hypothetical protein